MEKLEEELREKDHVIKTLSENAANMEITMVNCNPMTPVVQDKEPVVEEPITQTFIDTTSEEHKFDFCNNCEETETLVNRYRVDLIKKNEEVHQKRAGNKTTV